MLPPIVAVLTANTLDFQRKMGHAVGQLGPGGKFATLLKTGLAGVGIGVAVGLGAAAVASVKMANTFNAQMLRLHTNAQVPLGAIAGLSDRVLALAGTVGIGPQSLAEALYRIEGAFQSTGITADSAMAMLTGAAKLAQIGGADMVSTTQALNAIMASGLVGANDLNTAMGAIMATVGSGDMTMQQFTATMTTGLAAIAKGYGVTLTDIGAALATFGDNVKYASSAGNWVRMAIQALAVPAKSTAMEWLGKMHANMQTFANDMQKGGLKGALTDLVDRLHAIGLNKNTWGEALTALFGKRAGAGISVLLQQYDRFLSKYPAIAKGAKTVNEAFDKTSQTGKFQWDQIVASVQALAIKIGNWLNPILLQAVGIIMTMAKWLGPLFDNPEVQRGLKAMAVMIAGLILGFAGLVGAAVLLLGALTALTSYLLDTFGRTFLAVLAGIAHTFADLMRHVADAAAVLKIPGLPEALRKNADAIDSFAKRAQHALDSLNGPTVDVTIGVKDPQGILNMLGYGSKGQGLGVLKPQYNPFTTPKPVHKTKGSQHLATGGFVAGPPGQPSWILAHGGEYVSSREDLATGAGYANGRGGGGMAMVDATFIVDGQVLAKANQRATLRYADRNGRNGLTPVRTR